MKPITTFFRRLIAKAGWLAAVLPALYSVGYSHADEANRTSPEQLIGATQGFLEVMVEDYLQSRAIEGRSEVSVNNLDPRLRLAGCDRELTTTLESPAIPLGRVTVRVRCEGSAPWTLFVPAQVKLYRNVLVATRPLKREALLTGEDTVLAERDVGLLNQGYLTDPAQVLDCKLTRPLLPDQIITPSHLQLAEVVKKGDQVVITAQNATINVRMPGEALSSGAPGQQIRVRNLNSQRVIKARVIGPAHVEVAM